MQTIELVRAVHARMLVRYGSRWTSMYSDVKPEMVEADWCEQLEGVRPKAIEYALVNLPLQWPPNAAEFRALCNARPDSVPRLPAPHEPASDEVVQEAVGRARRGAFGAMDRQWANRLRQREESGHKLTQAQRDMWRQALGVTA